jgi:type IX secretion system PorP/SprF family membrane protein
MEITFFKKPAAFLFFILLSSSLVAQQDPMYSMYMFNPVSINPAYSGSTEQMQIVGVFRKQWLSIPGSPQTSTLTFHSPLKNEKMGLGFSFIDDRLGEMQTTGFQATYAYKLKLKETTLSFGLQAGLRNFKVNLADVQLAPVNLYDVAFSNNSSTWSFNYGAGIFWYGKKWFASFSIPHLRNNILHDQQLFNPNDFSRLRTHYNLYGGYVFQLNDDFKIKPSLMIKNVTGSPIQMDINANVYWKENYGLGISYRTNSAVVVLAEAKASKNFHVGYAFDIKVNGLSRNAGGSHELMIRYDFQTNKNKKFTERDF